jgi:hypothetical protein
MPTMRMVLHGCSDTAVVKLRKQIVNSQIVNPLTTAHHCANPCERARNWDKATMNAGRPPKQYLLDFRRT